MNGMVVCKRVDQRNKREVTWCRKRVWNKWTCAAGIIDNDVESIMIYYAIIL